MRSTFIWLLAGLTAVSARSFSTTARCGADHKGLTCAGSTSGNCCLKQVKPEHSFPTSLTGGRYGYCGSSSDHCCPEKGCQSGFGKCDKSQPKIGQVSPDGSCGGHNGYVCKGSKYGDCCSQYGYCGYSPSYCGKGCNVAFGVCNKVQSLRFPSSTSRLSTRPSSTVQDALPTPKVSTNKRCGFGSSIAAKFSGQTCPSGECCSQYGYCGTTSAYCGSKCQSTFGKCNSKASSAQHSYVSSMAERLSTSIASPTKSCALSTKRTASSSAVSTSCSSSKSAQSTPASGELPPSISSIQPVRSLMTTAPTSASSFTTAVTSSSSLLSSSASGTVTMSSESSLASSSATSQSQSSFTGVSAAVSDFSSSSALSASSSSMSWSSSWSSSSSSTTVSETSTNSSASSSLLSLASTTSPATTLPASPCVGPTITPSGVCGAALDPTTLERYGYDPVWLAPEASLQLCEEDCTASADCTFIVYINGQCLLYNKPLVGFGQIFQGPPYLAYERTCFPPVSACSPDTVSTTPSVTSVSPSMASSSATSSSIEINLTSSTVALSSSSQSSASSSISSSTSISSASTPLATPICEQSPPGTCGAMVVPFNFLVINTILPFLSSALSSVEECGEQCFGKSQCAFSVFDGEYCYFFVQSLDSVGTLLPNQDFVTNERSCFAPPSTCSSAASSSSVSLQASSSDITSSSTIVSSTSSGVATSSSDISFSSTAVSTTLATSVSSSVDSSSISASSMDPSSTAATTHCFAAPTEYLVNPGFEIATKGLYKTPWQDSQTGTAYDFDFNDGSGVFYSIYTRNANNYRTYFGTTKNTADGSKSSTLILSQTLSIPTGTLISVTAWVKSLRDASTDPFAMVLQFDGVTVASFYPTQDQKGVWTQIGTLDPSQSVTVGSGKKHTISLRVTTAGFANKDIFAADDFSVTAIAGPNNAPVCSDS